MIHIFYKSEGTIITGNDKCSMLWIVLKKIVSDTINRNKNINLQMSSYDLHDEEHSNIYTLNIVF